MRMKIKSSIYIIVSAIVFILMGIFAYNVFAVTYINASTLNNAAKNGSSAFWNLKAGDVVTNDTGISDSRSSTNWLCISHKTTTGLNHNIQVKSILDINTENHLVQYRTLSTSDNASGTEISSTYKTNNSYVRQLAYLIYAATVNSSWGMIDDERVNTSPSKNALYYFINATNLVDIIGNFSTKRTSESRDWALQNSGKVLDFAKEYARTETQGSSAEITGSGEGAEVNVSKSTNGNTYSYIGPFKIKTVGTISSVTIKDGNNSPTVAGYANSVGGGVGNIKNLPKNGNSFYIVTTDVLTNTNVSVTINTTGSKGGGTIKVPPTGKTTETGYIKARIIFVGYAEGQATAYFRGEIIPSETDTDSITFTAKNNLGKMTIQKVGAYAGNENYENVRDFGFKLYYLEGTTKKYLRINDSDTISEKASVSIGGNTKYDADANTATTIFTSSNGTVSIDNISVEHEYYIEESNTDDTNYSADIINATTQIGTGAVTELETDGNIAGPITVMLKGANNTATKIMLKDYRKIGNLTIEKVDKDDYNTKLGNVQFKVKNKDTGYYVVAEQTAEGEYNIPDQLKGYTQNEEDGTIFVTHPTTGTISITGLDIGNYEIIEINNPNYGYTVLTENVSTTLETSGTTVTIENEKQTGNLSIQKKDADSDDIKLEGVTFKIRRVTSNEYLGSGYVVGMQGDSASNATPMETATGTVYFANMTVTDNPEEATTFITDAEGFIRIYNILIGEYVVEEISVGDHYGYYVDPNYVNWEIRNSDGETTTVNNETSAIIEVVRQKSTDTTPEAANQGTDVADKATAINEKQTGNLKIQKKDADNDDMKLQGVSFRLRRVTSNECLGAGYVIGMQGDSPSNATPIETATGTVYFANMTVTDNPEEATTFVTDEQGLIEIYNILIGEYVVEEISVGDNFGYDIDPDYISWEITNSNGETSTVNNSTSATIEVVRQKSTDTTPEAADQGTENADQIVNKNTRKYIKVSGYAWEDKTDGKGSQKDYQWTDGTEDRRLQYITVTLKNADGIVLDTRVTNANGEYNFGNYDEDSSAIKLEIDELPGAYIEFEYNGMSYQSIPINSEFEMISATNTGGLNTANIISGTKNSATDEALRDAFNNNYATIRKGISQNTQDQKVYDIQYTYSDYISKVVYGDSVNYGYEGQTYPISGVYDQYEITAVTNANENNALCTQYTTQDIRQNSVLEIAGINLGVEEREMPDLNLSEQDLEKIEVQLNDYTHTYKYGQVSADPDGFAGGDVSNIAVRFASKYFESSYTREIYTADVVYNKQPGNEGKLKMYMTYKIEITNEATSLNSTVKTIANYYDARYENMVITDENGNTIDYQIDDSYNVNGLKKMEIYVNQQLQAQTLKTITIRYQLNNDAINALLNGETTLDSISEITGYSTYMDNTFTTPYAGIDVDSAPDTVIPGDRSTYEDDTNWAPSLILVLKEGRIIQGTVWEDAPIEDLLEGTGYDKQRIGDGQYQSSENIVNNVKVDLMLIDESGNLTLAKLYKRDETVVDATTTTSGKGEYSFVGVEPGNYVIRYTYGDNSVICDAEGNEIKNVDADIYKSTIYRGGNKDAVNSMTDYWYRGETSHEGAIRLSDAKDNEEFVNDRITEEEVNYETVTDRMQLTEISADTRKFDIKLDYDINLDNISEYGVDLKFVFDNIDFGIIERPRQSLQIDKEIGYLQLTLANGVNTINGDPRSQNLSGVVALPDGNIHIEVDNEIIQGATLKVTYNITVDNSNCEIDYNDEDYYIYGTVPANKEEVFKIATVVDMFDYLPEDVVLESTDGNNWEGITISEDMKGTLLANEVYEVVKNLQNVIHLKNPVFENMQPGSEAVDTSMVVTKQLSVSSDDLVYENDVEIVKLKGRRTIDSIPGNYDPTTNTPDEYDDDRVELTITGPTGENRQYIIYGAIGIGMLIIVGIGIVIIKRKILKK